MSTAKKTHRCPVDGCPGKRSSTELLCRSHWFKLPKAVRDRIWDLYQTEQGSERHRAAVFDAIASFKPVKPAQLDLGRVR